MLRWLSRRRRGDSSALTSADAPRFRFFGGRRHAANVPYALPKDDQEINRLDFQHFLLRYALRGNYAAPIKEPSSILDVGTGTGRWPAEMAESFPQARVVGVDVVTPPADADARAHLRPPNYTFIQGNALDGLPFADRSFDFVHERLLTAAIPAAKWQDVINELARVTSLGGWIESVEVRPAEGGGPGLDQANRWMIEACARRGIDFHMGAQVGELMRRAGVANVTQRIVPIPMGRYGGRIGSMMETNYLSVLSAIQPLAVAQGIVTDQEFSATLNTTRAQLERSKAVVPMVIAWGQRTL